MGRISLLLDALPLTKTKCSFFIALVHQINWQVYSKVFPLATCSQKRITDKDIDKTLPLLENFDILEFSFHF